MEDFIRWILVSQNGFVTYFRGFSDSSDEYIVKKYVDKRWVATSKVPVVPPGKTFRKQETRVIEWVSSGELGAHLNTCAALFNLAQTTQTRPLKLLRRGEDVETIDDASLYDSRLASIERIPEQIVSNHSVNATRPGFSGENSVNCKDVASLLLDDIDMKVPKSFRYTFMSPHIALEAKANRVSSDTYSGNDFTPLTHSGALDIDIDLDMDLMVMVCDIGIQTE